MKERHIWVTKESLEDISIPKAWKEGDYGSVIWFLGCVRNLHDSKRVSGMTYDCHLALAETSLVEIRNEYLHKNKDISDILIYHRVGILELGETSLIVGVASAHRANAFEVCNDMVKDIKSRIPIWKYEHYVDAPSQWLPGTPLISV